MRGEIMGNRIPDEIVLNKAKQLNVEILNRYRKSNGHSYVLIKCLTHIDKPEREVELYNFLNRDTTCGCMLQKYTKEDLYKNSKLRGEISILGDYINDSEPIKCQCKICGYIWYPTPNKLKQGRGCPFCHSKKQSSGERRIMKLLNDYSIEYEVQKKFNECKNPKTNRLLKFDFYLPYYNMCIEFNGVQHYQKTSFNKNQKETDQVLSEKLQSQQYRDKIKENFCKENNIKLLVISYLQQKDLENIIKNELNLQP